MRPLHSSVPYIAAALCAAISSCRSPGDGSTVAATEAGSGSAPGAVAEPAGEDGDAAQKKEAKARKAEKRAHDLEVARMELKLAEMKTDAELREKKREVEEAELALAEEQRAIEHFRGREMPQAIADARLDFDQAAQRRLEAEQELREMEKTYEKDQFALDTKELVLMRHRKQLEFATRRLELAAQEREDVEGVELPRKLRELEKKVREAEADLKKAKVELDQAQVERKIALSKARFEVAELERGDADDDEKAPKDKAKKGEPAQAKAEQGSGK